MEISVKVYFLYVKFAVHATKIKLKMGPNPIFGLQSKPV